MKPYDESEVGRLIRFASSEGLKQGEILAGEFLDGAFLGYTVYVGSENTNWVRVMQSPDGSWATVPVTDS